MKDDEISDCPQSICPYRHNMWNEQWASRSDKLRTFCNESAPVCHCLEIRLAANFECLPVSKCICPGEEPRHSCNTRILATQCSCKKYSRHLLLMLWYRKTIKRLAKQLGARIWIDLIRFSETVIPRYLKLTHAPGGFVDTEFNGWRISPPQNDNDLYPFCVQF